MPELPEVETVRKTLQAFLPGKTVASVRRIRLRRAPYESLPLERLVGERIIRVDRRAKLICLATERYALVVHLKMSGQLIIRRRSDGAETASERKAKRLTLCFRDGSQLAMYDTRRFGFAILLFRRRLEAFFRELGLGPEPLSPNFQWQIWQRRVHGRRLAVKTALLNQALVAGMGNIYADEALHMAGILPTRPVRQLSTRELRKVFNAIPRTLTAGIRHCGTTLRFFRDGFGREGRMQRFLRVYGREGERCFRCRGVIQRQKIGSRSSHFCPGCQR